MKTITEIRETLIKIPRAIYELAPKESAGELKEAFLPYGMELG